MKTMYLELEVYSSSAVENIVAAIVRGHLGCIWRLVLLDRLDCGGGVRRG